MGKGTGSFQPARRRRQQVDLPSAQSHGNQQKIQSEDQRLSQAGKVLRTVKYYCNFAFRLHFYSLSRLIHHTHRCNSLYH
jgi:hypothetical protein